MSDRDSSDRDLSDQDRTPLVLALDTTMAACSAALTVGTTLLAERQAAGRQGHAEMLMDMAHAVLADAGRAFKEIDRFGVTTGPGSFTGVRIGLAAARGFGLASGRPVLGIGTLDALAEATARRRALAPGAVLLVAVDARRGEIYWQHFRIGDRPERLIPLDPPAVSQPEGVVPRPDVALITGSGAPLLPADTALRDPDGDAAPQAAAVARLAAVAAPPDPYHPPKPTYLRAPDAKLPGGHPANAQP